MVEQRPFKALVVGSSPTQPISGFRAVREEYLAKILIILFVLLNVGLVFCAGPLAAFFARRTEVNLLVPRDRVEDTYRKTFRLSGIVNLIGVGLVALILMRNEIW